MTDDLLYIHREPTILRKGETWKVPMILNGPGHKNHIVDRAEFTAWEKERGGIVVVYEDDQRMQCCRTPLPPI